jgi:hypothetical protein
MTRTRAAVLALAVAGLGALFFVWKITPGPSEEKSRLRDRILLDRAAEKQRQETERLARGEPEPSSEARLDTGPNAAMPREKREEMVLELLSGRAEATKLPVIATEAGERFDVRLRDRIAPAREVVVPSRRPPCNCTPDDPLCACL